MGEARLRDLWDRELLERTTEACAASPQVQKGLAVQGPVLCAKT